MGWKFLWLCSFLFLISLETHAEKSIAIFTAKFAGRAPWDPDSIQTGITGSEEAVIYISRHLSALGWRVFVYGDPPKGSRYTEESANPRFIDVDNPEDRKTDIAISWRMPWIGASLKKRAAIVCLWPHDTISYKLRGNDILAFDDVLWLSEWQRDQWTSVNAGFGKFENTFGNGVEPEQFKPVNQRKNPHSCIYGSNYARGLEILLDIWPKVKLQHKDATLDIYYGWQHWNLLTPEKEEKMRQLIEEYALLDVVDHGLVGHEELNRAFENSSIWAYPCICPETFCITALRAQLAGALPVIIEGSALKETVRGGFRCSQAREYLETLLRAMSYAEDMSVEERGELGKFVLEKYTWRKIAEEWDKLFLSLLKEKAAAEKH